VVGIQIVGDNGFMTPDEAANFYEEDEDPREIFARFDAAAKIVTARPPHVGQVPATSSSIYIQARSLYAELRRKTFPKVSATGPKFYAPVSP
jgi:hypothetical protein